MSSTRKVIIDLDAGTDDAWALLMLLKGETRYGYEVIGITCVNGNTTVDHVVENVLTVLSAIGRTDVPVFRGAQEPLILPAQPRTGGNFHGVNGFGDIPFDVEVDRTPLRQEHAVSALHRLLSLHEGRAELICIGPLTNLALAIKLHPGLLDLIAHLYIMGGNRYGVGNITRSAEFNFHTDPEAAHIVLRQARCPTTIVPWETCQRQAEALPLQWRLQKLGADESRTVLRILNAVERKVYGQRPSWMPCDAFLVAVYMWPECVEQEKRYPVDVEVHGSLTRGQMVLDHQRLGTGHVRIIDHINESKFEELCWVAVG
uniref:Inosine/uridine-preferring nucleoside hydrolase domain-containing protein n=1 Tax=Anopheles dirus TaxID=7168 RepID=A0A182N906_9DIPT